MPLIDHNVTSRSQPEVSVRAEAEPRESVIRVRHKELGRFTRQLATLLKAGMPLLGALAALVEQFTADRQKVRDQRLSLGDVVRNVHGAVNEGSTLADAMAAYPEVFEAVYINMVAAGEASGNLESVLLRLADMQDKRNRLLGKVQSVLAYPAMMIVVAVGVVAFLLSYVVPSVTELFLEMNRTLPWPTRLLIGGCSLLKTYWIAIPLAVGAVAVAFGGWVRTEEGRMRWDRFKLKMPLIGSLLLRLEVARFARTLGTMLASGIPILDALDTVEAVVKNRCVAAALDTIKGAVGRGSSIADAVRQTELFPPVVVHLLATGQDSGTIEQALNDIAEMYDEEVDLTARTLTSLLEPAILLVMGAVVGFIVLAILLPIFEINQTI